MKEAFKLTAFFLAFLCFSCSNEVEQVKPVEIKSNLVDGTVKYQCPNKCEGDKTCDEPLVCPTCNEGMDTGRDLCLFVYRTTNFFTSPFPVVIKYIPASKALTSKR